MNILLIGGCGSLINNLIVKFNKEGHRVFLLTGNRFKKSPYQRVFERYDFPYDCANMKEIFESINMDVTIFMGAFDTNYDWKKQDTESVRYFSGLMNILMSYSSRRMGRFIYLSSEDMYEAGLEYDIPEDEASAPMTIKGMVMAQAEEICESYRVNRNLDLVTLRLDHLYTFPKKRSEVRDIVGQMCLQAMDEGRITIEEDSRISLLYESDAVEYIFRVARCREHEYSLYNITSGAEITKKILADMIASNMNFPVTIETVSDISSRVILSGARYAGEFGVQSFCPCEGVIDKITDYILRNSYTFLNDLDKKPTFMQTFKQKAGWFITALIPFLENAIAFIPFFMLNNRMVGNQYFAKLDFYLLYVLIFAIVYGQQQATFSAVLAVAGYVFRQAYDKSGFEVMLDTNTYVWIAQLFILGLAVGYMRDQISKLKKESDNEKEYLSVQLKDIQDINSTNVRVKDALETQLVNQNDSIGKIYSITSALNQYSQEEILFYAADVISKIMKSNDVAIYTVSEGGEYARLFSATSRKARELGNSIKYKELGELYEELAEGHVYINRGLNSALPLMANAITDDNGNIRTIILVWTLAWENMTLGQSNQLVIVTSLIKSAVIRANRYLDALENERYVEGTKILAAEAFEPLVSAFQNAEKEGLAECVILRVFTNPGMYVSAGSALHAKLRDTDLLGVMSDGSLCVILANTTNADSEFVRERFMSIGYMSEIVEDGVVCMRPDRV
ncbi:MAG: NAD(P)-dependent oxidoreductase [Lachnospiraceae bacterium]|nr:NAD(P)-dependent oxidoreductase [Lachnospiraceae bacterium]